MRLPPPIDGGWTAEFSPCGLYRYQLTYRWAADKPLLPWCGLNPSKARAGVPDQTFRKIGGFTQLVDGGEYGGFAICNPYAYCATKPTDLRGACYPIGPDNDDWIIRTAQLGGLSRRVICGWGSNARGLVRPKHVLELLEINGYRPMALRLTDDGLPWHPLTLSYQYFQPFAFHQRS